VNEKNDWDEIARVFNPDKGLAQKKSGRIRRLRDREGVFLSRGTGRGRQQPQVEA
jgi:hypothetical protein